MKVASEVDEHIQNKIQYHDKLRLECEEVENYEQCARHRDEIIRLKEMIA